MRTFAGEKKISMQRDIEFNLSDLTVIELASVLAGPMVGMFFAEMGAHVIKIENARTGGDITRQWKLPSENANSSLSAYYCCTNWHKKSLFLDLYEAEAQQQVYNLVAGADIVIANFKTGDAEKMGMDYSRLSELNPRLIYGQITAFPDAPARTAFDVILQAESGFMYMNGEQEGLPVKMPVALIDLLAAHQLKQGLLLALLRREKTGKGARVSVSLVEAALASLGNQATNWLMGGHIPQRMGTLHPNIAPYGEMFWSADKKLLVLAVGNDRQFEQLCHALNCPDVAADNCFADNHGRVKNRGILQEILAARIALYSRAELITLLTRHQVPVGAVRNMQEVFEMPIAQSLILEEADEEEGRPTKRVKTAVFVMD